jgi:WD40 repeat protein
LVSNREKAGASAANDDVSEATVEVAHGALFTCWDRLKNWIASAKRVIFVRNRLADDSGRWKRIDASDPRIAEDELWTGSRLEEALGFRGKWGIFFSPDGRKIATEKQVWEAAKGQQLFVISKTGSEVGVVRIALSPDSRRLATCVGKLIKIWDAASGNELLTFDNDAEVRSVAFTLDGKHLAAVGEDWTVCFHPLRIEDLMALAHSRVPRELSAEERQKYLHAK